MAVAAAAWAADMPYSQYCQAAMPKLDCSGKPGSLLVHCTAVVAAAAVVEAAVVGRKDKLAAAAVGE